MGFFFFILFIYFLRIKNNKHIVNLKKWVGGRVILFWKKCFKWKLKKHFYQILPVLKRRL